MKQTLGSEQVVQEQIIPLLEQLAEISKKNDLPFIFNTFFEDLEKKRRLVLLSKHIPEDVAGIEGIEVAYDVFGLLLENGPQVLMDIGQAVVTDALKHPTGPLASIGVFRGPTINE
jgi:hypothetical protein